VGAILDLRPLIEAHEEDPAANPFVEGPRCHHRGVVDDAVQPSRSFLHQCEVHLETVEIDVLIGRMGFRHRSPRVPRSSLGTMPKSEGFVPGWISY
jgi:hypothetical protein